MTPDAQLTLVPAPQSQPTRIRYRLKTATVILEASEPNAPQYCRSPQEAIHILRAIYSQLDADQEHFVMLCFNNHNRVTGYKVITSGGQNQTATDPKVIFRFALLFGAAAIVLAHNHPSGDTTPSSHDLTITHQLTLAAEILDLKLLDHMILEPTGRYHSMTDHGQIPDTSSNASD